MVVAMCLLEALSWVLYLIICILVVCSKWFLPCAYAIPCIFFMQYIILIWMIPLNLNWSRGLHPSLLFKSFILFSATVISFAFVFMIHGIVDTSDGSVVHEFGASLYFSITSWTTLGYGDFKPPPSLRLLTSFEAALGVLSMPLIFTLIWKYCDLRIRDTSSEDEQIGGGDLKLRQTEIGVWKQTDGKGKDIELAVRYELNPCKKCEKSDLMVERYFEIMGLVSPRMRFMVHCSCSRHVHGKHTAMRAVKLWNKKNPKLKSGNL